MRLNALREPAILIASSGEAGRVHSPGYLTESQHVVQSAVHSVLHCRGAIPSATQALMHAFLQVRSTPQETKLAVTVMLELAVSEQVAPDGAGQPVQ
jgi:hypothetical protein